MAETRMDYAPALPSPSDQHDARNLLAWAQRIMAGGYGKPGSLGYRSAVESWQANYLPWKTNLPPMPSRELVRKLSDTRPSVAPSGESRCGHVHALIGLSCEQPAGHEGRHTAKNGAVDWPRAAGPALPQSPGLE